MYSCVLKLTAACMVSYHGHALDEKTPLLRASDAMSREGARLCQLLGMKVRLVTRSSPEVDDAYQLLSPATVKCTVTITVISTKYF